MGQTFKRNTVDCSKKADANPTRLLQEQSVRLQSITCVDTLKVEMSTIVEGSAISPRNLTKFHETRDQIETLDDMVKFLFNFILAGSGLGTKFDGGRPRGRRRR